MGDPCFVLCKKHKVKLSLVWHGQHSIPHVNVQSLTHIVFDTYSSSVSMSRRLGSSSTSVSG